MSNKKQEEKLPVKACADCVHESACKIWTNGRELSRENAAKCPGFETVKDTAAYLVGKLDANTGAAWILVTPETMPPMGKIVLTYDNYGHVKDRFLYRFADGTLVFRPDGMIPGKHITHWREMIHPTEGCDEWEEENAEHCICCGDVIPEGRQVCPNCEKRAENGTSD